MAFSSVCRGGFGGKASRGKNGGHGMHTRFGGESRGEGSMGREEQEEWRCRLCHDVGVTVRLWYLTCDARMEALLSLADIPTSVRKAPPLC